MTPPPDADDSIKPIYVLQPKFRVEECLAQVRECLERGWTGMGFKTQEFEKAFCEATGHEQAYFTTSNTLGLYVVLKYLRKKHGWQDDDEIISTPLTFVSTNHAIAHEGLKPVFADVDETLCLDPESIEAAIGPRTRAVMYVGMAGSPGRLKAAIDIARKHDLLFLLDAAHMMGTALDDVLITNDVGIDCTIYSFQAVKNLPTGDAGMVCFAQEADDREIRKWGWMGIDKDTYARSAGGKYSWEYNVESVGTKACGNAVMAALALAQLPYVQEDNAYRDKLAGVYDDAFASCDDVRTIPVPKGARTSRHLYQIRVEEGRRDAVIQHLRSLSIYAGMHYELNTAYPMYAYGWGTCPRAELASRELLSLPLHLNLSTEDVRRVAAAVLESLTA